VEELREGNAEARDYTMQDLIELMLAVRSALDEIRAKPRL